VGEKAASWVISPTARRGVLGNFLDFSREGVQGKKGCFSGYGLHRHQKPAYMLTKHGKRDLVLLPGEDEVRPEEQRVKTGEMKRDLL